MTGDLFTSGFGQEADPKGDAARQAVNALRGFDYQVVAATLAWVDLEESGRLYLEVAETIRVGGRVRPVLTGRFDYY